MSAANALYRFEIDRERLPPGMRILGRGAVGGKARGLLYAAALRARDPASLAGDFAAQVRIPRSVVLASDLFEEFVEDNGLLEPLGRLPYAELRQRFLAGRFRDERRQAFADLLRGMRYPLAIRSSSAFEDSADHAFAGIYLTVFIANTGDAASRLAAFENAVRRVYASTYNDNAMAYRAKRRLADRDERMSVVVQRMIGRPRQHLVYPALAGVAFSRNFYPWSPVIRRDEGLVRLVFGLGTRAVGRHYARVVSLSHPHLRPEGHVVRDIQRYSQEVFDALNARSDRLDSLHIEAVASLDPDLGDLCSVARAGDYLVDGAVLPEPGDRRVLTFDRFLRPGAPLAVVDLLRTLLHNLEAACGLPVDIEFAATLPRDGTRAPARFYLLQLRPLGVRAPHRAVSWPEVPPQRLLLSSSLSMGNGLLRNLRHVVYVSPERYLVEPASATVSAIAEVNRLAGDAGYVLVGPGRWGTRNEQLGVPVLYGHISNARVLVELSAANFTPELSYGTHFFGDLFAEDVAYLPVFPEKRDVLQRAWFETAPGRDLGGGVRWIEVPGGVTVAVDGSTSRAEMFLQASA